MAISWCTPLAASKLSAVQEFVPPLMNELLIPPSRLSIDSERASFKRAHASSAEPNVDAAVEREASARRYALAVERRSEYAVCEASRSDFESTE